MNGYKVALIGTSGVGKTCFLAVLRWLGGVKDSGFVSGGADGESKTTLDGLVGELRKNKLPDSTDNEIPLRFQEQFDKVEFEICTHDFKGESLKDMESTSPLFLTWAESDCLFVMLDIEDDLLNQTVKREEDMDALFNVLMRTEMRFQQKIVAFLLMKSDVCGHVNPKEDDSTSALKYMEEKNPVFLSKIRQRGIKPTFFFISPLGDKPEAQNDGSYRIPKGGIQPFGYSQLFDWFVGEIEKRKRLVLCKTLAKYIAPIMGGLVLVASVWLTCVIRQKNQEKEALVAVNQPTATLETKAELTHSMNEVDLTEYMRQQIGSFRQRLEQAQTPEAIRVSIEDVRKFEKGAQMGELYKRQLDTAIAEACDRLEEKLVEKIEECVEQPDVCQSLIAEYRADRFIAHHSQDRIQVVVNRLRSKERMEARSKIRAISIFPFSPTTLQEKMTAVQDYPFEDEGVKAEADRAVKAMGLLLNQSTFNLTSFNASQLGGKRRTYLVWAFGEDEVGKLASNDWSKGKWMSKTDYQVGVSPQWNETKTVSWKPGNAIRIEWRWNAKVSFYDCVLGVWEGSPDDPLSFLRFLQTLELVQTEHYSKLRIDVQFARVRVTCSEFPEPGKDLDAIEKFLIPGHYWLESNENKEE